MKNPRHRPELETNRIPSDVQGIPTERAISQTTYEGLEILTSLAVILVGKACTFFADLSSELGDDLNV